MAAYFDALSRIKRSQQLYFTDSHRLKLFYDALRTADGSEATKGLSARLPDFWFW